ncbi:SIMPL domain-containing protein [Avibacterium avium]|uniref:SIMPL domain-containing protein n=1 Tax=Avibacterium avium TaxID=751 RepID=UPI003BF866BA
MRLGYLSLVLLALPLTAFSAESVEKQNIVSFSVEVEQEISHDLLKATLFTQAENKDLVAANNEVSKKINRAFEILKAYPDVELRDNSRSTQIRYDDKGKQNGWVARGQLALQSKNSESLSKAITELNGILAIEYVDSEVSSAAISQVEDEMMQQALTRLNRKATLIQQSLGAKGYQIVNLNIRTPMESGRFVARPYAAMAKMASPASSEVQLSNGKANVRASIEAKIQLIQE